MFLNLVTVCRRYVTTFFIFAISALSLIIVDLLVVNFLSVNTSSTWAFYKSSMLLSLPIVLLGIDQSLVRYLGSKFEIQLAKIFIKQICMMSFFIFLFFYFFKNSLEFSIFLSLSIFFLAILAVASAVYRVLGDLSFSQFLLNSWRVFFLFFFLVLWFGEVKVDLYKICFFAILFSFICSIVFFLRRKKNVFIMSSRLDTGEFYKHSIIMFFSMMSLNLNLYLDQFIISIYASPLNISTYFAYAVFVQAPAVFLSGFLGFIIAPKFRGIKADKIIHLFTRKGIIILCSLGTVIFILYYQVIGFILNILPQGFWKYGHLDVIIFLFSLISTLRLFYTIPSAGLGVLSNNVELRIVVSLSYVMIASQVAIFFVMVAFGQDVVFSMAVGVMINWIGRFVLSFIFLNKALKRLMSFESKYGN